MDQITPPAPLEFLTYGDVVESGACLSGVIEACKSAGVFAGPTSEMLEKFGDVEGEDNYVRRAAKLDGGGYGDGGI